MNADSMSDLPELLPHDDLRQVFPNIFCVTGQMPVGPGGTIKISRSMTIVREGTALTLLNTVRLSDQGLTALDALGTVTHLVKLGSFHGRDDAFYVRRYPDATMWAPPEMPHERGVVTDRDLGPDSTPVSDASVFVLETSSRPEALLRLDREGGILIVCDSFQNRETPDHFHSDDALQRTPKLFGRGIVGPGWLRAAEPEASDFERLATLPFQHLLPAHGIPLLNDARSVLRARIAEAFSTPGAFHEEAPRRQEGVRRPDSKKG